VSGGGSLLNAGGETETGKEASAGFFLHIGGGEREGVVPVLHVDDGRPMAHRFGGTTAQYRVPYSVPLTGGPRSGFRRVVRARSGMDRTVHDPAR
jgi:hypothetical protein